MTSKPICCMLALGVSLCIFVAGDAFARPEMAAKNVEGRFEAMDADKNGKISREEFAKAHPEMREAAFDAIDKDKDGQLTIEEWAAFAAGHGRGEAHPGGAQNGTMPPPGMGGMGSKGASPSLIMPPRGE